MRIAVSVTIAVAVVLVIIRIAFVPKNVNDDDLRSLYLAHKAELGTLKQMFLEDAAKSHRQNFVVVPSDNDWARLEVIGTGRFERYRELLTRSQILSVRGDTNYVHFLVRSVGWGGGGRRQGLGWSATPLSETGQVGRSRFVPVENGWYIFDIHQP